MALIEQVEKSYINIRLLADISHKIGRKTLPKQFREAYQADMFLPDINSMLEKET